MPDDQSTPTPDEMKDAAKRSQEAGIAAESAAYETASESPDQDSGASDTE